MQEGRNFQSIRIYRNPSSQIRLFIRRHCVTTSVENNLNMILYCCKFIDELGVIYINNLEDVARIQ